MSSIQKLKNDLKIADERAGRSERMLASANDTISCFRRATERRKVESGYDASVSFDVVWDDVLKKANKWDSLGQVELFCDDGGLK